MADVGKMDVTCRWENVTKQQWLQINQCIKDVGLRYSVEVIENDGKGEN